MTTNTIKTYNYHVWANQRVFARLQELPEEVQHQEAQDVFPTIHKGLVHIFHVDMVWLTGMKGGSYEQIKGLAGIIEAKTSGKSLIELEAAYSELAGEYKEFLSSAGDLQTMRQFNHPVYGVLNAEIGELVQHVVNHGTYHRGNISSMLRQLGHAGVASDYVYYLYEVNK